MPAAGFYSAANAPDDSWICGAVLHNQLGEYCEGTDFWHASKLGADPNHRRPISKLVFIASLE